MATLQQALTRIDAICPNAWDETAKLLWLNECESMIQMRILGAAPEACITYAADTDRSTTLIVPAPFDRLYVYYVIAMCDYAAHETAHYADSMMLFNAALDEYAKWYQRTNGSVTSTPGLANEIAANSKARHTHENLAVLNAITAGTTAAWNAKADRTAATATAPGLMSAADKRKLDGIAAGANKTVVDAALDSASENPVQNKAIKAALNGKAGTAVATASANGLMSAADKVKLDGIAAGANKTVVDAALDGTSENPVQNKAVKTELDKKLNLSGGTVTGSITVEGAVFSDSGLSFGAGENIHFTKAADDAAKLAHGAADVNDNVPLARLKVATPTEGDDAATKQYVDAHAGGNDKDILNAPVLTSPVMIRKEGETNSAGVYLSTIGTGEKRAEIRLEDVNENSPVAIANLRTPTGAGTDNYAATKGYVDSKVAAAGGNITVDATLSATSTNPVQNKAIKAALDGKAGTAVATASANGLMSAADKAKLDGIDDTVAAATPITIMLGSGGKATSSASYADICQALTSGRSVMLVGATGKAFWHLLSHTVGNNSVALMYAGISVSGDGLEVTGYTVTVTASGITYISRNWTSQ